MSNDVKNRLLIGLAPETFNSISRFLLTLITCITITACVPIEVEQAVTDEPAANLPELSAAKIEKTSNRQRVFAQTALAKLGFKIGPVDGIWGPKSAAAIRTFEAQQLIKSAQGFLSELNLHRLESASGLSLSGFSNNLTVPKGVKSKLNGKLTETGPQLIILENSYKVFDKPNPFSQQTLTLQPGTGVYIISKQEGWYQIESINRRKGFIQAD